MSFGIITQVLRSAKLDTALRRYDAVKEWHGDRTNAGIKKTFAIATAQYKINIMKSGGYIYIMASKRMGTLYIGSTSDLIGRVWEHKNKIYPKAFTAKHKCNILVHYEYYDSLEYMVKRERQLKEWNRNWKIKLIIENNPDWKDLYPEYLISNGYSPN